MASTSLAYAARQNGVAPISSTPDRSVLKLVNQTFLATRALTSAPLSMSSFIKSRYEQLLLQLRPRLRIHRLRAPLDVEHGVERRDAAGIGQGDVGAALDELLARSNWPLMTAISSGLVRLPALTWLTLGAAVDERADGFAVALPDGEEQRRQPALRADELVVAELALDAGDLVGRCGRAGAGSAVPAPGRRPAECLVPAPSADGTRAGRSATRC